MITIMFMAFLFQANGIFITNLTNSTMPWNTTMSSNLTQAPNIFIKNIPWGFPAITLMLLLMTDYIMAIKRGVDLKTNFISCALVYTMISYISVLGGLETSNYFYIFEFLMLIALAIMSLLKPSQP